MRAGSGFVYHRSEGTDPALVGECEWRRVQLVYPGIRDADMGWAEALADMDEALPDPVARYLEIEHLTRSGSPRPGFAPTSPGTTPRSRASPSRSRSASRRSTRSCRTLPYF